MPWTEVEDGSSVYWTKVYDIIAEASREGDLQPSIINDYENLNFRPREIVREIQDADVVVGDVSNGDPNVWLGLGMRLAFDKPVVIISSSCTDLPSWISPLKCVSYPRDLRFHELLGFKGQLRTALSEAVSNPQRSSFLKMLGNFKAASLERKDASQLEIVLDELKLLRRMVILRTKSSLQDLTSSQNSKHT